MKMQEVQSILNPLIPKIYAFAFALVADELQAEQLVIDSFSVFGIKDRDILEGLDRNWSDKNIYQQFKRDFFKTVLKNTYMLSQKRFGQLYQDAEMLNKLPSFYQVLSLTSRAAIYLKQVEQLKVNDVAWILGLDKIEVIQKISEARFGLEKLMQAEDLTMSQVQLGDEFGYAE
jgi:DNA-directed RNA polymerase specialized sigma24 family protein